MQRLMMARERTRLRFHFARELVRLRTAPLPPGASAANRAATLARLEAYARRGRFPLHGGRGRPRPVFVDHRGTPCAVGHLLAEAGHAPLVAEISRTRNHAYVADLGDVRALPPALAAIGITAEEAARIQPSYDDGSSVNIGDEVREPLGYDFLPLMLAVALTLMIGSLLLSVSFIASERFRQVVWDDRPRLQPWITAFMVCGYLLIGLYLLLLVS
jgi:hypothetical protein